MTNENENNFAEILEALAKDLSCDPLRPEADGRVLFSIDDKLGVALFPVDAQETDVDAIVAVLVLGPAPDGDASFLRRLLCANYLGSETADGTLAIDEGSGCLMLTRVFELPVDTASFMTNFGRLVNAGHYWSDSLLKESEASDETGSDMMKV